MIPEHLNQQILQAFSDEMQEKYYLVYTDYNDSFNHSAKTVQECMDKHDLCPLYEIVDDWIYESQYEMCKEYISELEDKVQKNSKYAEIHPYIKVWLEEEDNKELIRDKIADRDHSNPISEMISRTSFRARVTQFTNYDCLPTNFDMRNTYHYEDNFKDIVDTLYLNPAKVKQTFIKKGIVAAGNWKNLSYRNGKEAVEYDAFADEVLNQCCYSHLVFMGMFPLQSMYENRFEKFHKMIIPKGNCCGFYSHWQGGGSLLGMELKRDIVLPIRLRGKTEFDKFELDVDETNCNNGYCINDAYGMIRAAWGKEIQLVYKP